MKKVFKLKTFWLTGIIAIAVIFLALLNANRTFQSETDILIIPKSDVSVKNAGQIIENIQQIPYSLSFYKRMLADNPDVADTAIMELPDYKQKVFWNSEIKVERVGISGELKIIASDKNSSQAQTLSSQASSSLIGTMGLYYDIKNDLDVRIIDPTITQETGGVFNYLLFTELSVGALIVIFFLFLFALSIFEFEKFKLPVVTRPNFSFQYKNPLANLLSNKKSSIASMESAEDVSATEKPSLKKTWPMEEKPYTAFVKTASAPANLPIAEEDGIEEKSVSATPLEESISEIQKVNNTTTPIIREATAEEVKERLNKLLSGKL